MIKLKYGNVALDVFDGYEITNSSQDVAFNDLVCDFTNHTIEELPEKYQETKLVEIDNFRK
ncbi:MAG: hypothetical protein HFJ32_05115 [Clostridia bacterium]|nr:hypothetical protein [Clostridia bacterium]